MLRKSSKEDKSPPMFITRSTAFRRPWHRISQTYRDIHAGFHAQDELRRRRLFIAELPPGLSSRRRCAPMRRHGGLIRNASESLCVPGQVSFCQCLPRTTRPLAGFCWVTWRDAAPGRAEGHTADREADRRDGTQVRDSAAKKSQAFLPGAWAGRRTDDFGQVRADGRD